MTLGMMDRNGVAAFLRQRGSLAVFSDNGYIQPGLEQVLRDLPGDALLLDLGSANRRLTPWAINLDLSGGEHVDFTGDLCETLPFASDTFDFIACTAVLEHVAEPVAAVAEIYRILHPGGRVWSDIPFLQPLHRVPSDFQRYTIDGIRHLFRAFDEIESGNACFSGLSILWILDELRKGALPVNNDPVFHRIFEAGWPEIEGCLRRLSDSGYDATEAALAITGGCYFYGRKPQSPITTCVSVLVTPAILDRLTHRSHVLLLNGDSYRLRGSRRRSGRAGAVAGSATPDRMVAAVARGD